jgi:hydroxymethylglutaryl-CoA lyase
MHYPDRIVIREVSPRDGLQGEPTQVGTDDKVRLIDLLSASGVERINATSFVSPRAVPQMADAEETMSRIERRPGVVYDASVPNLRGALRAIEAGADAVMVFVDASDEGNRRSVRRTTEESLAEAERLIAEARARGIAVAGTVGMAFGSPYEGRIAPERVVGMAQRMVAAGACSIALGDTTGEGSPRQVAELIATVLDALPGVDLGLHFHDTRGLGMANVLAAMDAGATRFDASVGGIGGNPFLHNAAGNICTEDLVHMCEEMGIATGLDLDVLIEANRFLSSVLGRPLPGKVAHAGRSRVPQILEKA